MSLKEIEKKYGKGVLLDASFLLEEERRYIPVAYPLDISLKGGGISEGSIVLISGKEGSGKTTTALTIAKNAQKKEYGARKITYSDIECRLKKSTLEGVQGLEWQDADKFQVIRSTLDTILTGEQHLNLILDLLKSTPGGVFIIDSASALATALELEGEIKPDFRANAPKLLASFCRHVAPIVLLQKSVLIILQRLIADSSGKTMGLQEDGGNSLKYAADYRLRIKYTDKINVGSTEDSKQIGQMMHFAITKSPFGPADKIDVPLRFGVGIDEVTCLINIGIDLDLITKGGSWLTLDFAPEKNKIQGVENLYKYLIENTDLYNLLKSNVDKILKS